MSQASDPPGGDDYEWYYSQDEESWHVADSRDDAIAQGRDIYEGGNFTICRARKQPLHDDVFPADTLIEMFEDYNEENWGEDGPDGGNIAPSALRELEEAVAATFAAWRAKHGNWVSWAFAEQRDEERITAVDEVEAPHG